MPETPRIIVLSGPNGAGKSTAASRLVPSGVPFLNADDIAAALRSSGVSGNVDIQAGRLLLERLEVATSQRRSFALETTLASRSLAPKIALLKEQGYRFLLLFIYVPDVELSIARVASRVRLGGHDIPEQTIRRRYQAGIRNFFDLYSPMADRWRVYDNTSLSRPRLIASGSMTGRVRVYHSLLWKQLQVRGGHETI